MVQSGAAPNPAPHPSLSAQHALTAFSVNGMVAPPTLPPQTTPGFPLPPPPISGAANANLLTAGLLPPHPLAAHMLGIRSTAPMSVTSSGLPAPVSKEEHRRSTEHSAGKRMRLLIYEALVHHKLY